MNAICACACCMHICTQLLNDPGWGAALLMSNVHMVSACPVLRYLMINAETYGGGLWYTWFDRDLGLAGEDSIHHAAWHAHMLMYGRRMIQDINACCKTYSCTRCLAWSPFLRPLECRRMLADVNMHACMSDQSPADTLALVGQGALCPQNHADMAKQHPHQC